jgi:transposase
MDPGVELPLESWTENCPIFEDRMIKYTEQFKLKVVKDYLKGPMGYALLGAHHGVAAPHIRNWVAAYRLHGSEGLRRKVTRYDAKFKLSVLQHMWDNGLSNRQAAVHFNVRNPTSIGIWGGLYREGGIAALARPRTKLLNMKAPSSKPVPKPDEERSREDLLKELEYLRMENEVLKKLEALAQARKTAAPKKRK